MFMMIMMRLELVEDSLNQRGKVGQKEANIEERKSKVWAAFHSLRSVWKSSIVKT